MDDELAPQAWMEISSRWPRLLALLDEVDLRLSPRRCASTLRLSSADELERELRRRGLVRFRVLRDWWYVVRLHDLAARMGSLAAVAAYRGDYLSVLTRFVARVTGREWKILASVGSSGVRLAAISALNAHGLSARKPGDDRLDT